ncbi:hypothetical protein HKX48_004809 [Thoreauomyces humboldtii]|nr:hypothetical protein HKX48_004809 [Thoreauomyces humboldtii]
MDESMTKRSKRLFGVLNGTLMKAKKSSDRKSEAEKRREELEAKLAEKLRKDKEELSAEVQELWEQKQTALRIKREEEDGRREARSRDFQRDQKRNIINFLQTKAHPAIHYLPKNHNARTLELLTAGKREMALRTEADAKAMSDVATGDDAAEAEVGASMEVDQMET